MLLGLATHLRVVVVRHITVVKLHIPGSSCEPVMFLAPLRAAEIAFSERAGASSPLVVLAAITADRYVLTVSARSPFTRKNPVMVCTIRVVMGRGNETPVLQVIFVSLT